jgi:hypothetical protein
MKQVLHVVAHSGKDPPHHRVTDSRKKTRGPLKPVFDNLVGGTNASVANRPPKHQEAGLRDHLVGIVHVHRVVHQVHRDVDSHGSVGFTS